MSKIIYWEGNTSRNTLNITHVAIETYNWYVSDLFYQRRVLVPINIILW